MKSLSRCLVWCFLALAVACTSATPVKYDVIFDYDVNADFAALRTYRWETIPGTAKIGDFNRIRIIDAVNARLAAKGLKEAANNPDIFVVMFGGTYKEADLSALQIEYPIHQVGRLKLAFYESKSNREIWWAETRADLFREMTPQEMEQTISEAIERLLEVFPPKAPTG